MTQLPEKEAVLYGFLCLFMKDVDKDRSAFVNQERESPVSLAGFKEG